LVAIGGEDFDVEALDRDGDARLGEDAIAFGAVFLVGGVEFLGALVVLDAFAVIDEVLDGQLARELRDAADVVFVEVSDEEIVDGFDARVFGAAAMRSASRLLLPDQPVSTSRDSPEGAMKRVPGRLRRR